MPNTKYFVEGDWNGVCGICGRAFKFSELKIRWDGIWADADCFNPRQPQDFLRAVKDVQAPPVVRARVVDLLTSLLAAPITAFDTTLTVTTGDGALFPTDFPFFISLQAESKVDELVRVTNVVVDTFTIVRNVGGFPAQAWATASQVVLT